MPMLRTAMLQISRNEKIKDLILKVPATRDMVRRFVPGEGVDEVLAVVRALKDKGLHTSIDVLGEDTLDRAMADRVTSNYVELLARLGTEGLADHAEVSVKLSAVGQFLGEEGETIATDNARLICAAARNVGSQVNLDMEDHTTVDSTLRILAELRREYPETACVLQAYLFRTHEDIVRLATDGQRIRLCKGAYDEPAEVAHRTKEEVDLSYVRCLKALMRSTGYPMIASHDPRMIGIAEELAARDGKADGEYEFQMLYGIRPHEQERLAAAGHKVRVYVPFGTDWYGYYTRRLAERPANILFFLRSFTTKK